MPSENRQNILKPPSRAAFEAGRTGLASFLFAILRPRDAKAASVNDETVRLMFGKWPVIVRSAIWKKFEVTPWAWSRLRVRTNPERKGSGCPPSPRPRWRCGGKPRGTLVAAAPLPHSWKTLKPATTPFGRASDPPKYFNDGWRCGSLYSKRECRLLTDSADKNWPDAPESRCRDTSPHRRSSTKPEN